MKFELAGGSTAGLHHRHAVRNNHDAWHFDRRGDAVCAVVCDGCGSGAHSEVGAKIGVRLIVEEVLSHRHEPPLRMLNSVRHGVLAKINLLADAIGDMENYFLFTVVGVLITGEGAWTFGTGDGFVYVNGTGIRLGNGDNYPAYLAYPSDLRLITELRSWEVDSILIGTDGLDDVKEPVDQFWKNDRYFRNPFNVQRKLNLLKTPDDTSLVVLRKWTSTSRESVTA